LTGRPCLPWKCHLLLTTIPQSQTLGQEKPNA
jgi:hypothetical protein